MSNFDFYQNNVDMLKLAMADTKDSLQPTEKDIAPKISEYAVETTQRILAHVYGEMYKLGDGGNKAVETIKEIARNWDGNRIKKFQVDFEALEVTATKNGNKVIASEIDHTLEELDQKSNTVNEFVTSSAGKIVGAEMLISINYHPEHIQEPIVLAGIDFVVGSLDLERLQAESEKDIWTNAPEELQQFHSALLKDQAGVANELRSFREIVVTQQPIS